MARQSKQSKTPRKHTLPEISEPKNATGHFSGESSGLKLLAEVLLFC